ISSETVPEHTGPIVRCVNEFRAIRKLVSILPVLSRKYPFRALTDHKLLSGLWFHCQTSGNARSPFLRVNSSEATIPGIKPLPAGRSSVSDTLPLIPKTGHPSTHFTGTK